MLCIRYLEPHTKYIDEIPQIYIYYRPTDETLEEFVKIHDKQHIYIDVTNFNNVENNGARKNDFFTTENMERFKELKQYPNWSIVIDLSFMDDNKFRILPDICNEFVICNRVDTLEDLQTVLSYHPNEIYITNELCFDLPNIKAECDKRGAKIRVVANIAQCRDVEVIPPIKRFFIRPEDVEVYSQYIHGIEFYGNKNIQEVCYQAYSRKYWWGELSELIVGLDMALDSRRLPSHFGELRAKCGKRCIRGGNCSVCRAMEQFATEMTKTETYIKI